ncbi:MAG: TolC family protein [Elusimicrobia bacterium]|nr:TolC family protein [Elusimicrobiota bacterium]
MRPGILRRWLAPLAVVLLAAAAARAQQRTYTLDDAVAIALKNDSRLLSAEQDRIIAEERVREAELQFLPELGLQASATKFNARYPFALSPEFRSVLVFPGAPENIYSARGYMFFPVYEGGRSVNTIRLAQAALQQALSNYESVKMDVVLAAKEAFYRLIHAQARVEVARAARLAGETAAADSRSGALERIEAEAELAAARRREAEAGRELVLARLDFQKALNLEPGVEFQVAGALATKPLEVDERKASLWAVELRPELQSETYRAQMDAIAVNLAMGRRSPTLFVAGDYEVTAQRFPLRNNNWDVSAGIKIPLAYDYFTKLRQRRAEQRQGQLKRASLQDQVRLEVRQAVGNLSYWQGEVALREPPYRKVARIYESLAPSAGSALARFKASLSLADLHLSYLAAVNEHLLARARLERAVGRDLTQ